MRKPHLEKLLGESLHRKNGFQKRGEETNVITSLYLSENDLDSLGNLEGASVQKHRYTIEHPDRRVVYDIFQGVLIGLIIAEVEFQDYDSLSNLEPESGSLIDVTSNQKYSGGSLAFSVKAKPKK